MRDGCRLLLLLLALAATPSRAETWRLDPVHTRVLFVVDHAGLSQALGTFAGAEGTLQFSEGDWAGAKIELLLPLASLDLGDAAWRERVLGRTFLDGERHPQARFVSTRVDPQGADRARVHGRLTLRGVTREIVLDVRLNAVKRHPVTLRRTAGFSATARLDRADFGIDTWPNVIGPSVELRIETEAILDRTPPTPAREERDDAVPQQ